MPSRPEALAQGKTYHRAGQLELAEQLYRQMLQDDPADAEVYYLLGALCQASGRLHDAAANLRQAVRLRPAHAESHNHLGLVLATLGSRDEAIAGFQEALRLKPDFADAQMNLQKARADSRNPIVATLAPQTQGPAPEAAKELNRRGSALAQQGKPDEAIACFRRATEIEPDYFQAHGSLGNALKEQARLT
jgi:protein O-GlcNAc transferase